MDLRELHDKLGDLHSGQLADQVVVLIDGKEYVIQDVESENGRIYIKAEPITTTLCGHAPTGRSDVESFCDTPKCWNRWHSLEELSQ